MHLLKARKEEINRAVGSKRDEEQGLADSGVPLGSDRPLLYADSYAENGSSAIVSYGGDVQPQSPSLHSQCLWMAIRRIQEGSSASQGRGPIPA